MYNSVRRDVEVCVIGGLLQLIAGAVWGFIVLSVVL